MARIPANETPEQRMKRLDREAMTTYRSRRSSGADSDYWYKKNESVMTSPTTVKPVIK